MEGHNGNEKNLINQLNWKKIKGKNPRVALERRNREATAPPVGEP